MYGKFGIFRSGEWVKGGEKIEVFSPVSEESLGTIAAANHDDTSAAIDAAYNALDILQEMGGFARADALTLAQMKRRE